MIHVLGIETSCDDSCVAIINDKYQVLSNVVSSQTEFHRRFGGIVPEVASRKHLEYLPLVLDQALRNAHFGLDNIDFVAVTRGPGLLGSLLMGVCLAKTIALFKDKPFLGVNHLEGHLFAIRLEYPEVQPPFLALIVSGGHTEIIAVRDWGKYCHLGSTRDDAAGEAYDKVSKFLNLGYPGGPIIDRLSEGAQCDRFQFSAGLEDDDTLDFSFSGLKTAVVRYYSSLQEEEKKDKELIRDLVASFQESVARVLVNKTFKALEVQGFSRIVVGGGVAANRHLRAKMEKEGKKRGVQVFFPSPSFCTDNGAMVAACGLFHWERGRRDSWEMEPDPQLPLISIE
ncbi:MAG TPA: tRNA (adenosine(37)-N6)-threonylcarbamoyltransferase complex transferase subunit TsaD [Candidatus Atribacteria bacterium]|nr:tRNA (adenosine(37)-N6)-threonylcarbamoyltransferase complex transferase subunit TsaD [Candidatus Atribacteria bacterium]